MEAIQSLIDIFHNLSVFVIVLLVAVSLGVCYMMVRVFKGDFDNLNSSGF